MLRRDPAAVRALSVADQSPLRHLLETSEYTYVRFTPEELPRLLSTRPALGTFSIPPGPLARVTGGTLQGFLLVNSLVPPSAWIGGFGVTWSESGRYRHHLDLLLPAIDRAVAACGARTLYYSGHDMQTDWLRADLEARGFRMLSTLRSYDKYDHSIPSSGNQRVRVRPFVDADAPGVVAVENEAFAPLWHYDEGGFREVNELYPYFVVAEDEQGIVGYQFNAVDGLSGYLVRIAVHPRVEGQGVATRLMAEAVRYFTRQGVTRILLNTEEVNTRAHRLYERFGFELVHPRGFVLARDITDA